MHMRIHALLAAASAATLLVGCGLGQPSYPTFGEAAYRLEGTTASPDGGAPNRTIIYRDGPRMRVETSLPGMGEATIVFDESTHAAYVLDPTGLAPTGQAPTTPPPTTPPNTPLAQPANPPAGEQAPTTTPNGATPATNGTPAPVQAPVQAVGIAVRIDNAQAPEPLESAWAALGADNAKSVGECEAGGESGHDWRPRDNSTGIERTACISDDGIVLRISQDGAVLWEVTSVRRGPQNPSLFGVPPGYQLVDPQAVADQVGEQMDQLDGVTNGETTPQPQ
jgi:hypothetical protein